MANNNLIYQKESETISMYDQVRNMYVIVLPNHDIFYQLFQCKKVETKMITILMTQYTCKCI